MFVKFDCGCIGIVNLQGDDRPVVVKPCDGGPSDLDRPLGLYRRDLSDKRYEPLPGDEAEKLLRELGNLVCEGYQLRQVRWLLAERQPT